MPGSAMGVHAHKYAFRTPLRSYCTNGGYGATRDFLVLQPILIRVTIPSPIAIFSTYRMTSIFEELMEERKPETVKCD